ncbi:hypothetical protein [Actinoplanes sp. NPDC051411]|uniref:hypothetical protein n=1 Tax=Actinoplanes sp. NPDC051411 TaxID=3155522 RepID=UPI003445A689
MKALLAAAGVVVLGVIGWLVWPAAPGPLVLHASTRVSAVTVTIARPRLGTTDLDISTSPGAFILAQGVMPLIGYATPEVAATAAGGGRYTVAAVHLMTTGPWELRLAVTPRGGTREDLVLPFDVTG